MVERNDGWKSIETTVLEDLSSNETDHLAQLKSAGNGETLLSRDELTRRLDIEDKVEEELAEHFTSKKA